MFVNTTLNKCILAHQNGQSHSECHLIIIFIYQNLFFLRLKRSLWKSLSSGLMVPNVWDLQCFFLLAIQLILWTNLTFLEQISSVVIAKCSTTDVVYHSACLGWEQWVHRLPGLWLHWSLNHQNKLLSLQKHKSRHAALVDRCLSLKWPAPCTPVLFLSGTSVKEMVESRCQAGGCERVIATSGPSEPGSSSLVYTRCVRMSAKVHTAKMTSSWSGRP